MVTEERYQKKQPILIGTTSVENSELISKLLTKNKIDCSSLDMEKVLVRAKEFSQDFS